MHINFIYFIGNSHHNFFYEYWHYLCSRRTRSASDAFSWCYSLESVYYTGSIDGWAQIDFENDGSNPLTYAHKLYINNELITEAHIKTATKINAYAFYGCTSLSSIKIGNSIESIGSDAFANCNSLSSVYYSGSINEWVQINFESNNSNPLTYAKKLYVNNQLVTAANITTATKINAYAFYGCTSLSSVTLGNSIESIGRDAFCGCASLSSATIGNRVEIIESRAFYDCSSLIEITIPSSVTSIGQYVFSGCSSLAGIVFDDKTTWYRCGIELSWQRKTGGSQTSVANSTTNKTNFSSSMYWYKLDD